jgi:hypothetical protein
LYKPASESPCRYTLSAARKIDAIDAFFPQVLGPNEDVDKLLLQIRNGFMRMIDALAFLCMAAKNQAEDDDILRLPKTHAEAIVDTLFPGLTRRDKDDTVRKIYPSMFSIATCRQ